MARIRHSGPVGSILTAKAGGGADFVMKGPTVSTTDITAVSTSQPFCASLSNDGLRLLVGVTPSQRRAYQFTLDVPNDISTAVYAGKFFAPTSDLYGVSWSEDGTKLLACYNSSGVFSHSLSDPDDISTAGSGTVKSLSYNAYNMRVSRDGLRLFTYDITTKRLAHYTMSTPWGAASATHVQSVFTHTLYGIAPFLRGCDFSDDGKYLFMMDNDSVSYTAEMSIPWDLSTAIIRSAYKVATTLVPTFFIGTKREGRLIGGATSPSRLFQSDLR